MSAADSKESARELPPYLVLLRVGFALPAALLPRRCALTAPFHPYPGVVVEALVILTEAKDLGVPRESSAFSADEPIARLARILNKALTTTPGRYVFCGTFRRADLNPPSRTLSGTLLCGVRTFLPPRPKTRRATVRSGCLQNHYMRRVPPVPGFRLPEPFRPGRRIAL